MAQATKPRCKEQVCPLVLELERVACLRVFSIGLKSGGGRFTAPLGIPDGLDRPLDAAVRIHGEGHFGVAIAHPRFSGRLRTRSDVPLLKASALGVNGKQGAMNFPLPDIGGERCLSTLRTDRGRGG